MNPSETSLDIQQLRANADAAGQLLKALANPDRLLLLCQLAQGERNVSELEAQLGIQQPTLSQQLAVLRREGLVATRREGKQIHYRISSPEALAVIDTLYRLFCAEQPT
ncbi:ArsR/SmtB family transcription factor [Pseudomonas benzenivorans]|uniref:Winged helix-turn-helix transcriptional regulator n=1 Tax=Pseudomonas benzenivorans TaxID=556533 RepID=A0ABY5H2N9_9PSED|nr:metalloregulator ArsR/SmtB family transcription factor [Pseudomonas benzenivorans]UTW06127.1 winged helix-turn-helix transcriptional regulator [Pseudomonas benzenivorans]